LSKKRTDEYYKKQFHKYQKIFRLVAGKKFGINFSKPISFDEPVLILSNHTTDWDFIILSSLIQSHFYVVCEEHVFGMKVIGNINKNKLNSIPIFKGSNKAPHVLEIVRRLRQGNSVLLFPEGTLSHNGLTGNIDISIAKLMKISKCKVVTVRLKGGFFLQPRFRTKTGKGKMISAEVVNVYDKETIQNLPLTSLQDMVNDDLYVDAYKEQEIFKIKYGSKNMLEGVERYYNVCPKCHKIDTLTSKNNTVTCSCGYKISIDEYGLLHGENLAFNTFLGWEDLMKKVYAEKFLSDGIIFKDFDVSLNEISLGYKKKKIVTGLLFCDRFGFTIGDKRFEYSSLDGGDILFGGSSFVFGADGKNYELFKENSCMNKYCLSYKNFA